MDQENTEESTAAEPLAIRMPVDVRSLALTVIAIVALIFLGGQVSKILSTVGASV